MSRNGITQWGWRDLEELLQCPVCLDTPGKGIVEQCGHGHHICASCRRNVEQCPLCKCEFFGTRNFFLEELLRHFEVLKNTMLLNNIDIDTKRKHKAKKALIIDPIRQMLNNHTKRLVNAPACTKGTYPCRAPNCKVELPLSRLLNHCRSHHSELLIESEADFTDVYRRTIEISIKNKNPINKVCYIIFVCGIGLIFLNFEMLKSGPLIVFVQMASKLSQCQNFCASFLFSSETNNYSYNTRLVSTRIGLPTMMQQYSCFTLNQRKMKKNSTQKKFKCQFTLTRYDSRFVLTQPNHEQIQTVAGMRASLILENDGVKKKGIVVPSTSQYDETEQIEHLVTDVLKNLNLHDGRSNISGTATNSSVPATSSSTNFTQLQRKKKNIRTLRKH